MSLEGKSTWSAQRICERPEKQGYRLRVGRIRLRGRYENIVARRISSRRSGFNLMGPRGKLWVTNRFRYELSPSGEFVSKAGKEAFGQFSLEGDTPGYAAARPIDGAAVLGAVKA
jgi:hypothetical protein